MRNTIFSKKINYVILTVTIMVIGILYLSIQSVTSGVLLSELENEQALLSHENQMISHVLASKTSLVQIHSRADDLGFIDTKDVIYLGGTDFYADSSTLFLD